MDYRPGDVANGYVLGADLQWHPLSPPALPPDPSLSYWNRYRRRWKSCFWWLALIGGVFALAGNISRTSGETLTYRLGYASGDLVAGGLITGLVVGSMVCLIASIPSAGSKGT